MCRPVCVLLCFLWCLDEVGCACCLFVSLSVSSVAIALCFLFAVMDQHKMACASGLCFAFCELENDFGSTARCLQCKPFSSLVCRPLWYVVAVLFFCGAGSRFGALAAWLVCISE